MIQFGQASGQPSRGQYLGAATNKRGVFVIDFSRKPRRRGFWTHKAHFANQMSAPGLIHPRAKLLADRFRLFLPRFSVDGHFQASRRALNRASVRRQRSSDHLRPGAFEPRQRSFRPLHAANDASKKFACLVHGCEFSTAPNATCPRLFFLARPVPEFLADPHQKQWWSDAWTLSKTLHVARYILRHVASR